MKNWIVYIASIFISLNALSQKKIKSFDDAIKEFNSGNYELSIPYFKRIAFFESNNILNLKYLADSYQNTKSYDKALVHYSLIYNISKNDSIKNEVIIEMAKTYILQEKYDYAKIEALNIKEINQAFTDRKNYYLSIISFYLNDLESSKNYLLLISNLSVSTQKVINDVYKSALKSHLRPNPKVASFLSMVLPGSGQLYCGEFKSGINSFLLTGTAITVYTLISIRYSFIDAILGVFPYYQRYYTGGVINAQNMAKNKIKMKKIETVKKINEIIFK
jgi:tetratricopeptide (TPR) repeat protein